MELRHLRYFAAVAQEGSLTKAAARLGIHPNTLASRMIRLGMRRRKKRRDG